MDIRDADSRRQEPQPWRRGIEVLFDLPSRDALILCAFLFAIIGLTDYFTPSDLNLTFLYVFVIFLVCWNINARWGLLFATLASFIQITVLEQIADAYSSSTYRFIDIGNRLFTFYVVVALTSPLKRVHDREKKTARIDWLTGAANRQAFVELLLTQIARYERNKIPFSVAYLDLDDFKEINDRFGHEHGDLVLRTLTEVVRRSLRKTDTIARLGGDEFAILFSDSRIETAIPMMQRVREELETNVGALGWPVTMSIGLGEFDRSGLMPDDVTSICDSLMYRVKRDGKKNVAWARYSNGGASGDIGANLF